MDKLPYLFGETFVHLRNDMTAKQATDEMCLVADIGSLIHFAGRVDWPPGVRLYLRGVQAPEER